MKRMYVLALVGLLGCAPKFESYFPLTPNQKYVYQWAYHELEGQDELYCRSTSTQDVGQPFFYFVEADEELDRDCIIGSEVFGPGAYFYEKGALYTAKVFWRSETEGLVVSDFELLFPKKFQVGDTSRYVRDGVPPTYRFEIAGYENVRLDNTLYPECLRLNITQIWPGERYTDVVWLYEDLGVVKWQRSTGRIDLLAPNP